MTALRYLLLVADGFLAIFLAVVAMISAFHIPNAVTSYSHETEDLIALTAFAALSALGMLAGGTNCLALLKGDKLSSRLATALFHASNILFVALAVMLALVPASSDIERYLPAAIGAVFLASYLFVQIGVTSGGS
ncbi:MAG: hypothetical protein ACRED5_05805 [Propylenella sp.]